ncbi:hypothetical protein BC332_02865 [Capsicum chinense]|nr:hypothetical protein BC332_02865 [Capsicum chinense]
MPMHLDQHTYSRMVVELGTTMEVVRDDQNGKLNKEETSKVMRNVVMEKNGGENVKAKVKELRKKIREKGEEEFDQVVKKKEGNTVGLLVGDPVTEESSEMIQWLNGKDPASTVLVFLWKVPIIVEADEEIQRVMEELRELYENHKQQE